MIARASRQTIVDQMAGVIPDQPASSFCGNILQTSVGEIVRPGAFGGRAVGYLAYDAARWFEPVLNKSNRSQR